MEHKINGVPLAKCTTAELRREWLAGQRLEEMEGLSPYQEERLRAIEREYYSRPNDDTE